MNNKKYFLLSILLILLLCILGFLTKKTFEYFTDQPLNMVDSIMYINLENRPERKELLLKDFDEMKFNKNKIHRISAVNIPKNGHKGCIQSHLIALRMAKMNDWNIVCIMEDDAEIIDKKNFNSNIKNVFNDLSDQKWDMLTLEVCNEKIKKVGNKKYINKVEHTTLGTCYIVKSHYYDKLINLFEYCNQMMIPEKWGACEKENGWEPYALDQKWNELVKKDNWYCPKKNLVKQRNIWSSTNTGTL